MSFFSKFNSNEYNNKLEKILDNKTFDEDVKNLLLSMLYKIENGYNDYFKVKPESMEKAIFMEQILETIEKYCFQIQAVTPETDDAKPLKDTDSVCLIEPDEGTILVYANEEALLYSLVQMRILQKEMIYKINNQEDVQQEKYYKEAIRNFIIRAKCINDSEVVRDFDGWSWNNSLKREENIQRNLIFQNLLLLNINYKNADFYTEKYKQSVNSGYDYDRKLYESILSIEISENESLKNEVKIIANKKEELIRAMENRKDYLEKVTEEKKKLNLEIKNIDEILNDKEKLKKEYIARNAKLPNKEKIFSISHLVVRMENERKEKMEIIKQKNKFIEPVEYVKVQENLENEYSFLKRILENAAEDNSKEETLMQTQIEFLKLYGKKIEKYSKKEDWENILYSFRYYCLLPVGKNKKIYQCRQLNKQLERVMNVIIDNCIDKEIITNFSNSVSLCYNILKHVFSSRIIDLKEMQIKINKQKEEKYVSDTDYYITVGIYDSKELENVFNEKVDNLNLLNVKLNRKIALLLK